MKQDAHIRVVNTKQGKKAVKVNPGLHKYREAQKLIHQKYRPKITDQQIRETKAALEYNYTTYPPPRGFLLNKLFDEEDKWIGRYKWYMESMHKGKIILPIPQVEFGMPSPETKSMLKKCTESLQHGTGEHSSRGTELFIYWLGYGLGSEKDFPKNINAKTHAELITKLDISLLLKHPADYMASMLEEAGSKGGPGWFATPMNISVMMNRMTSQEKLSKDALDCCVGTGGMLLAASNNALTLSGQDVSQIMVAATKVNFVLYAPHGAHPFPKEMVEEAMTRAGEHSAGLEHKTETKITLPAENKKELLKLTQSPMRTITIDAKPIKVPA